MLMTTGVLERREMQSLGPVVPKGVFGFFTPLDVLTDRYRSTVSNTYPVVLSNGGMFAVTKNLGEEYAALRFGYFNGIIRVEDVPKRNDINAVPVTAAKIESPLEFPEYRAEVPEAGDTARPLPAREKIGISH